MRSILKLTFGAAVFALSVSSCAFSTELHACFTPGQDCTAIIVHAVDDAKSELLVQAYGFTSPPIIQAIGRAKERGVDVKVILDKINEQKRYTGATYLTNHEISVLIDDNVAIAHNKVIVIDSRTVVTGSFNFTQAAQSRNAENVLLIEDEPALAEAYSANWKRRATASRPLNDLRSLRKDVGTEPNHSFAQSSSEPVKKSSSGICHAPGTTYYSQTKKFTPYKKLEECLKSGGRLPKK